MRIAVFPILIRTVLESSNGSTADNVAISFHRDTLPPEGRLGRMGSNLDQIHALTRTPRLPLVALRRCT